MTAFVQQRLKLLFVRLVLCCQSRNPTQYNYNNNYYYYYFFFTPGSKDPGG